jgi:hypothetical protein
MAVLWMTRDPPEDWGWKTLLVNGDDPTDGTVAIAAAVFLLVAPNRPPRCFCFQSSSSDVREDDYEAVMNETMHRSSHDPTITTRPTTATNTTFSIIDPDDHIDAEMKNDEEVSANAQGKSGEEIQENQEEEEEAKERTGHGHHGGGQSNSKKYQPILTWSAVQDLNWDIVFLLGGGFALSLGFQVHHLPLSLTNDYFHFMIM